VPKKQIIRKGKGFWDDIKTGISRATQAKKNVTEMSKDEVTSAKLAQQAYKTDPLKNVDGWRLIKNETRIKIYEKGDNIKVAVRGTKDGDDVGDNVLVAFNDLESSDRFKHLRKTVDDLFENNPTKNITFTGHSLGSAMIYYLYKQLGDKIKGDVFNPAVNVEVLRSIVPKSIKSHIIEGDIVSDFLGKLLVNKQVYNNPLGTKTTLSHNVASHRLSTFIDPNT